MFHIDLLIAIRHALRRSRVRTDILLALLQVARASLPDIVRATGADPRNVHLALHGDGKRYRIDEALVALGLVEVSVAEGVNVYVLTPYGQATAKLLQQDVMRRMAAQPVIRV